MIDATARKRWERMEKIFHRVADKTATERTKHLDGACAGDEALRREVESLLAYRDMSSSFLTASALELVADTRGHDVSRQPFPDVLTAIFDSDLGTDGLDRLRITTPQGGIKTMTLDEEPISVGRAETNLLSFPEDDGLSREHFLVEPHESGWMARDLGSKNGTFLNGVRLEEPCVLKPGDKVSASCITLTYVGAEEDAKVTFEMPSDESEPEFTECIRLSDVAFAETPNSSDREQTWDRALWAFARASRELAEPHPLPEPFEVVLLSSLEVVSASRGLLLTLDASDSLVSRASSGGEFRISTTIRDRVLKDASSVLVQDVEGEARLRDTAAFSEERPCSLMAVPLQTTERVIGLLYVDSLDQRFSSEDLHLLTVMASVAGVRVEREYWEQQRRFLVSENLASLSRLSAALSHELNSPLGTLRSTVSSLMLAAAKGETAGPDEKLRLDVLKADLKQAMDASLERMQDVIERIQRFTNLDGAEVQAVDLEELWADVIALGRGPAEGDETAVSLRADAIPAVTARPQQLSTAFAGLLSFLRSCFEERETAIAVSLEHRGSSVMVRVEGVGIDLATDRLRNLFQPQFEIAEGRVSMGNWSLFSARQVVRAEGGEMAVEQSGHTIVFTITLPVES